MKRIRVLVFLPILLLALERVNLIKDCGFEKNSEVWHTRVSGSLYPYKAKVDSHDSENAFTGFHSGTGDTRTRPDQLVIAHHEEAFITQGFTANKKVADIDSLMVEYCIYPRHNRFDRTYYTFIFLHLDANLEDWWKAGYTIGYSASSAKPYVYLDVIDFIEDTMWHTIKRNIGKEIMECEYLPLDANLDSIIFWVAGGEEEDWRGQKVFFDDVRLMGYADYDVGVKEITSVTETIPYTPAALIKNFGREPAEFSVVAEILQGETQVYHDSIDWSLPADTEDTIPFSEFIPQDTGAYLLRIYTVMDPDESDADDEQTKELHFEAIAEPPVTHPQLVTLEVKPSLTTPLHVSYSLPKGHTGTLTLFDLSGRRVESRLVRGYGSATFNSDVAAGVYIVKLEAGGTTLSRKVVVGK